MKNHYVSGIVGMLVIVVSHINAIEVSTLADEVTQGDGQDSKEMTVTMANIGHTAERVPVAEYTLTNGAGMRATVMTLGATLTGVYVPDREGRLANVTLYLDSLEDYLGGHPLFGSVVGRFANRIAGACFRLDGQEYRVTPNAGQHHIHGGRNGFQKLVWDAEPVRGDHGVGVRLTHNSPDGTEGYPGTLNVQVEYRLTAANELVIEYKATSDKPTHVNLTNHAYWNLAGAGAGTVLDHKLYLNANAYLPSDAKKIPTGEIRAVVGTPMDFNEPCTIGSRIEQVVDKNYDHCYVVNQDAEKPLSLVARVSEPTSGRVMEVHSTQPGVQLYTAKGLSKQLQGGGRPYGPYHGFCLEAQHFPNAPNEARFPSTILRPSQTYHELTVHRFSVRDAR